MDRGLGVNTWNPYGNGMTTDSPFQSKNVCGEQANPLFKKSIQSGGFFQNEYIEALKTVAGSELLTTERFAQAFETAAALYGSDATPSKRYGNAWDYKFTFDLYRTCKASDSKNMSFKDYINAKKTTLAKYIDGYVPDIDNSEDPTTPDTPSNPQTTTWNLYLRGNFNNNNWTDQMQYKFKDLGNGLYSVNVTCSTSLFKFKVVNSKGGNGDEWYNKVDEEKTTVWFEYQGGNENVQVNGGSYTIYFDTNSKTLYITEN
jgi:hypothetical protein